MSKRQTLINGRSLVTMVKLTVGYVKKAMAHNSSLLDSNKQLPSGNYINDLLDYVLDEMWEENLATSKSKKKTKISQNWTKTEKSKERKNKKNGPFSGTLLFVCLLFPLLLNPTIV